MDEHDDRSRGPRRPLSPGRTLALGLGVVVLLALVAAASRAHHTPGGHPGGHRPPSAVGDYLFSIFAVVMTAGLLGLVYLVVKERGALVQQGTGRRGRVKPLTFLVIVALFAAIFMRIHGHIGARPPAANPGGAAPQIPGAASGRQAEPAPHFKWLPVLLAGGGAIAMLGIVGARSLRRTRSALVDEFVLDREFEELVEHTLADLYAETDARRAIIACYARVERLFASFGLPRDPAEAPHEYLDRVLPELRASASALRRLTRLFERAKFSEHDVDRAMRDRAIDALVAVRDELRAKRLEVAAA
jgi:hypothetical protein